MKFSRTSNSSSSSVDASSSSTACSSSSEALLEVLFDTSVSTTVLQEGGMSVTLIVPHNGTVMDAAPFQRGDPLANLTMCLPKARCYGLQLVNVWRGHYSVRYDGTSLTDSAQKFPYYMRATDHDISGSNNDKNGTNTNGDSYGGGRTFAPYESNLTFVEVGPLSSSTSSPASSCAPACDPDTEALYEVRIFGGNNGEASLSWRIQRDDDTSDENSSNNNNSSHRFMGCEDDPAGDVCGNSYDVRVSRACLPKAATTNSKNCLRFVMGNPNVVPSEGPDVMEGEYGIQGAGHYHPTYRVSVDGTIVAEGTSPTFTSREIGGDDSCSSQCAPDESLLEIFQYRTGPVDYSLRELPTLQLVAASPSNSTDMLRYDRHCVPSSVDRCYDLAFESSDAPFDAPSNPVTDGVSTQVILDGIYYANALVRDVPFRVLLGDDGACDRQHTCSSTNGSSSTSLVRVDINTSGTGPGMNESRQPYLPSYYCAWSVFDTNDPPRQVLPEVSMRYFANGYPSDGRFRHSMCVSDVVDTTTNTTGQGSDNAAAPGVPAPAFGMLDSVAPGVTWSVSLNGAPPLDCRWVSGDGSPDDYWRDYIRTPLDGSCPAPGPALSLSVKVILGIGVGIVVPLVVLFVAVFVFSWGDGSRRSRTGLRRESSLSSLSSSPGGSARESDSLDWEEYCGP